MRNRKKQIKKIYKIYFLKERMELISIRKKFFLINKTYKRAFIFDVRYTDLKTFCVLINELT